MKIHLTFVPPPFQKTAIKKRLLLILLAVQGSLLLPGQTTYYVADTGSDANPGTAAAPFRTIQKCVAMWGNSQAVTCACAGTFNEEVVVVQGGPSPTQRHVITAWDTDGDGDRSDEVFVLDGQNNRNIAISASQSQKPDNVEIAHLKFRNYFPDNGCNGGGKTHFIELQCTGSSGCTDWWIHHCSFEDMGVNCPALESYIAIRPTNASRLVVENNLFQNIGGFVMRYIDGNKIQFKNNQVNIALTGIKGWGAHLDSMEISGNIFQCDGNGSWANLATPCMSQHAIHFSNNAQHTWIHGNTFYDCVTCISIETSEDFGFRSNLGYVIENNVIHRTELTCNRNNAPIVIDDVCDVSDSPPYNTMEVRDVTIRNNIIHYYGEPITLNQGPALEIRSAHPHVFTNNFSIYNNTIRGFRYGIRFLEGRITGYESLNQLNGVDIQNNIFSQIRDGHFVLRNQNNQMGNWTGGAQPGNFSSDHNTFSGANLFRWNGNKTLSQWQPNFDPNSVACEPQFANLTMLRLDAGDVCARNAGVALVGFDTDIDLEPRGYEGFWDVGADEYFQAGSNLIVPGSPSSVVTSNEVTIYPNPGKEQFFVKIPDIGSLAEVVVSDLQGKTLKTLSSEGENVLTVDMAGLPGGIYFIRVKMEGLPVKYEKWVKAK